MAVPKGIVGHVARPPRPAAVVALQPGVEFRFARYLGAFEIDADEIDDLRQATYVVAWSRFGWDGVEPIIWPTLLECCREACRTRASELRRSVHAPAHGFVVTGAILNSVAETEEDEKQSISDEDEISDLAWDCLLLLPPRQREVVLCRAVWGKSERETAVALRCALGTVKAHYHRGLARLRKMGTNIPIAQPWRW